jgi:hypothetical protein
MIPPSKRYRNVLSWSDPVVVPSDPRARAARAVHEICFEKLRKPALVCGADAMRQFPTVKSTVDLYSIDDPSMEMDSLS